MTEHALSRLEKYLSTSRDRLEQCIDSVEHEASVGVATARVRLHHLKFDGNGMLMVDKLAQCLVEHVIEYALAVREGSTSLDNKLAVRLTQEARRLFIRPENADEDETGEAGELLLHLLIEAFLGATQVVAKLALKTNVKKEVNGSDGIHMAWREKESLADVYFGEAKMHAARSSAVASAFKSIEKFHDDGGLKHELLMVTRHFKYLDVDLRREVVRLVDDGTPSPEMRINHVCLIGYDWPACAPALGKSAVDRSVEFRNAFLADAPALAKLIESRLSGSPCRNLRFEIFFLPMESVQKFRTSFNSAVS